MTVGEMAVSEMMFSRRALHFSSKTPHLLNLKPLLVSNQALSPDNSKLSWKKFI